MKKINQLLILLILIPQLTFATIDLELNLTSNKTEYSIYQQISYTLTASNTGNEVATGIKIKFPIAPGVAYSNSNTSTGSYNLFFQEWTIPTLEVNQEADLQLTIFTLNEDAPLPAYAQVIAADQNDSDSTPNNGTCCTANEDDEASLTVFPEGYIQESDLRLLLFRINNAFVLEGNEFPVSVIVYNDGPSASSNVTIQLDLPKGLTFAANQNSAVNPSNSTIHLSEIEAGGSASVEVQLLVGNKVGELPFFAQIQSADQTDPDSPHGNDTNQTPDEDDEDLMVVYSNITDVALEMRIDADEVSAGQIVTFTLDALRNFIFSAPATDVVIQFRLPDNLEYISHQFGLSGDPDVVQSYLPQQNTWQINAMNFAPPHGVSYYQLELKIKVLEINAPTLVAAEFIQHTPADIDSQPSSFPSNSNGFVHDQEDDEAIVTLYPTGTKSARISGSVFFDPFRQGMYFQSNSKDSGLDGLRIHLYDSNDLNTPIQTVETFSNDIVFKGRYEFNHLDPSKQYVIEYTSIGVGEQERSDLLPSPIQRSPHLGFFSPNANQTPIIQLSSAEDLDIDFGWVAGANCTLEEVEADLICNDQNTSNPNDDTYNIRYTALGQGGFSVSGAIDIPFQEYPNNRQSPSEHLYSYPQFDTYSKWFKAELNLPASDTSPKTLTFQNEANFPDVDCSETLTISSNETCSQDIDMELLFFENTLSFPIENTPNPPVNLAIKIYNRGTATATNVEVEMYLPETGFPDGKFTDKVFHLTQGSFEEATQIWTVGDLAAGANATLNLNAVPPFNLGDGETLPLFAQVTRAHGYDPDSDVNNDTDQTADEDDEGLLIFGDSRKMDVELVQFYPLQSSYMQTELVEFFVEVRNSMDAEIELDDALLSLELPDGFEYDSFDFASCQGNCFFLPLEPGFNFFNLQPGESASIIIRYRATSFLGTADVFAQIISQQKEDIDSKPNNGVCCTPLEDDEAFAQVQIEEIITTPVEKIDLELQYTTDAPTFNRWTHVNYTLTISNTAGFETASNVVIDVSIPNGLAFSSQNTSKGNFNLYFQTWTIPELIAGESATLNLTLFTLTDSPVTNFAQVVSVDQMDSDSFPNNNTSNIPQEDDEAAVTIHPNSSSGGKNALEGVIDQSSTLKLYELFPVPALDHLQVVFGTAGNQVSLVLYDIHGKLIRQSSHRVLKGENALQLEVSDLAAGFYTVSLESPEGFVRGKFLKQ